MTSRITAYHRRIKYQRRWIKRHRAKDKQKKEFPIKQKIFPFAPGIVWKTKNNYIIPEVHPVVWDTVLQQKKPSVICNSGLLESFYSLSYVEAIHNIYPDKDVMWIGNSKYNYLVHSQNIAKISPYSFSEFSISQYPTPIFMDLEDNFYFNSLLNYIKTYKIIKTKKNQFVYNNEPIIAQIFKNAMLDYVGCNPVLRLHNSLKYDAWMKSKKLSPRLKYILIFQDEITHDTDCLQWTDRQIREFSEMLRHLNISVICCQKESYDIYKNTSSVIRCPLDLEIVISLITNAYCILSNTIDYLLISLSLSKAMIFSKELPGIYNINDNADFISSENIIFTDNDISPRNVLQILEQL